MSARDVPAPTLDQTILRELGTLRQRCQVQRDARRDTFAAAALQGLLSHHGLEQNAESLVQASVETADMILAELDEVKP